MGPAALEILDCRQVSVGFPRFYQFPAGAGTAARPGATPFDRQGRQPGDGG